MKQFFAFFTLITLCLSGCTEPITVGGDILGDDRAEVDKIDDLPFATRVVREDDLLVFRAETGAPLGSFSFGESNDDVFGKWTHSVSITPDLRRSGVRDTVIVPSFVTNNDVDVDSVVLIIPIDTAQGFYGSARTFPVRMFELSDPAPSGSDQFANAPRPATGDNLLEGGSFSATAQATILYDTIYTNGDDTISTPHIRLKFAQPFVDRINALTVDDFKSDTTFRDKFQGIYLEPMEGTNAYVTLTGQALGTRVPNYSGFYFFSPSATSTTRGSLYVAPFKDWFVRYDQDFSGTLAETLLADGDDTDIVLAGGAGSVMTEIEFTDLSSLRNTLVNRAEFTFTLREIAGYDPENSLAADFLDLYYRNAEGNLLNIVDVGDRSPGDPAVRQFLGGFLEMDGDDIIYRNRLSQHLQRIIDADFSEPKIYLRVAPNAVTPARVVLSGPSAAEEATSLDVVFTRVQ